MILSIKYKWNNCVRKWKIVWKQALCSHDKFNTKYIRQDDNFVYTYCQECGKTVVERKFY